MVAFTILVLFLIGLVVAIAVGGFGFLVVFGDIFICGAIIYFIVKKFIGK